VTGAAVAVPLLQDDPDRVEIVTVGVDVGSSTSHLLFSRVRMQRLADRLSSRYVVVERTPLWSSPILLTPFDDDGLIDADALAAFVASAYRQAGIHPETVDSGAVILTGEALRRANASAIAQRLASDTGRFVCASAGHHLEAVLAAHGSGAVAMSRTRGPLLHLDIGGGTTKLAVVEGGRVRATAAVAVGGRLVAYDERRRITRAEPTLAGLLGGLGVALGRGDVLTEDAERRLADALAAVLAGVVAGDPGAARDTGLLLTEPLPEVAGCGPLTVSGGVAEYLTGTPPGRFGDLAPALAAAVRRRLTDAGRPLEVLGAGIRATVVGASQFSVQVSGNTIGADEDVLPLRNLPVVHVAMGEGDDPGGERLAADIDAAAGRRQQGVEEQSLPALHLGWSGEPSYRRLLAAANAVARAWGSAGRPQPLVVVFDRDVAASFARVMRSLPGISGPMVILDGLDLGDLDYLDVGRVIRPAGVVPVVVKSLMFP
jgi:ethanolamine utilization protein EutA